jgi:hypothetical protein
MNEMTLDEYYHDFRQEILVGSEARQDFLESEFALYISSELEDSGIIEGFEPCHYRAPRGMRVDGYWFREEEAAIDIFIVDFQNRENAESLTKTEVINIFKRLENFFVSSVDKHLYEDLEETSPSYGLARDLFDRRKSYAKVNLYLISERKLSERIQSIEEKNFKDWALNYHIWDMSRFYRLQASQGAKEDLEVDFSQLYGKGLQCLPAHLNNQDYESYLLVMPADILADLYGRYGGRLLEQNVRCFLQARGKVNKGLRATIMNDPGMFFAYNNGITATAKEVVTENNASGLCVSRIRDLQIVNGGQTTASLFHTSRKDKASLDQIFVQMKLSIVDDEKSEIVVPKISEYANTQNKVNAADFFSNHPFHIRMEEFSRRIWAPPQKGALRETKWFYERARGQYLDAQSLMTPAAKKKFKAEYPKPQMFNKTDLAKFANAWEDSPHIVSRGAQKNFAAFASEIGKKWDKDPGEFNELYFKTLIAKAIVFRTTEKLIMKQDWYGGGYRANIVVYSISWVAKKLAGTKRTVNFIQLWEQQQVSPAFYKMLEDVSYQIHRIITDTPENITNVTEWCKREGCWLRVKNFDMDLNDDFPDELKGVEELKEEKKDAKKVQKIDDGITCQEKVLSLGAEKWKEAASFGLSNSLLNQKDMGVLAVAARIPEKIPSEKQCIYLIKLLKKMELEGFKLV